MVITTLQQPRGTHARCIYIYRFAFMQRARARGDPRKQELLLLYAYICNKSCILVLEIREIIFLASDAYKYRNSSEPLYNIQAV